LNLRQIEVWFTNNRKRLLIENEDGTWSWKPKKIAPEQHNSEDNKKKESRESLKYQKLLLRMSLMIRMQE